MAKQLRRKIEETTDKEKRSKLWADLHVEVNEAYTIHHPSPKHISVSTEMPKKKKDNADDDNKEKTATAKAAVAAKSPPMWNVVKQTMKDGPDALRQLRQLRE